MKKCKQCAEEIQDEAKVCKHCGKKVKRELSRKEKYVAFGVIALFLLFVILSVSLGDDGIPSSKSITLSVGEVGQKVSTSASQEALNCPHLQASNLD